MKGMFPSSASLVSLCQGWLIVEKSAHVRGNKGRAVVRYY